MRDATSADSELVAVGGATDHATNARCRKGVAEEQSLMNGDGDEEVAAAAPEPHLRRSSWANVSMTLCGEIMGTGVLSLPYATAQLGWVVGLGSCLLFGLASTYSGVLLARMVNDFYADAHSYADLSAAIIGPRAGTATRVLIGSMWALILPYYLMATVSSLIIALPDVQLCYWQWAVGVACVLLPPLQLRDLHSISYAAGASTAAMVAAVFLILFSLATTTAVAPGGGSALPAAALPPPTTRMWPKLDGGVLRMYASFGSFIFAYQGQSIFLEIMREMRQPRHFPRAVVCANSALVGVYALTSIVGYGAMGDGVAPFLPSSMPPGVLRRATGLLLAFHVGVGCMIIAQPLHRALHLACFPRSAGGGDGAAAHWALLSCCSLLLAIVVANAVPFFADFQNLIGSLLGAPILFGGPAALYLRACTLHRRPVPPVEAAVCYAYVLLLTPLFSLLGTANAVLDIVAHWEQMAEPFACKLEGF